MTGAIAAAILLAAATVDAAASPGDLPVRRALIAYLDARAARDSSALKDAAWPDSCRYPHWPERARCDRLVDVPHSMFGTDYKVNDVRIWRSAAHAVASVHASYFTSDPEGLNTGERGVCLNRFEFDRRRGEWKVSGMAVVYCKFYKAWRKRAN